MWGLWYIVTGVAAKPPVGAAATSLLGVARLSSSGFPGRGHIMSGVPPA